MEPVDIHDYQLLAKERLDPMVYDFFVGGSGDELSVEQNRLAWDAIRLNPRVLVDVSQRDLSTTVLGQKVDMPVLIAPCGTNALAHPDGESAVSRAAASEGVIYVVSTMSNYSMEEIASASDGPRWFQLYCFRDREVIRDLVARAEAAGYTALCVTVDVPLLGVRERDKRNRFGMPDGLRLKNLEQAGFDVMTQASGGSSLNQYVADQFDASLTWELLPWLREITTLPIVIKGILNTADAGLAVERGVNGIIVSNHGGRQLDGAISGCEALPAIVQAVGGATEILVDGGIRRGTDVLKALAMGAQAVLVGKAYLWGLAVDGEAGVRDVLGMLRAELSSSMALAGRPNIASIDRDLIA
jgi:4-hydroxymandelate oxidase